MSALRYDYLLRQRRKYGLNKAENAAFRFGTKHYSANPYSLMNSIYRIDAERTPAGRYVITIKFITKGGQRKEHTFKCNAAQYNEIHLLYTRKNLRPVFRHTGLQGGLYHTYKRGLEQLTRKRYKL